MIECGATEAGGEPEILEKYRFRIVFNFYSRIFLLNLLNDREDIPEVRRAGFVQKLVKSRFDGGNENAALSHSVQSSLPVLLRSR